MKRIQILGTFVMLLFWQNAQATPVTYSGADLLNLSAVNFPNGLPFAGPGSSVIFDRPADNAVVFTADLSHLVQDANDVSFSINVTRRSGDFDIFLAITDGVKAVGGAASDNIGGQLLAAPDVTLISSQKVDRGTLGASTGNVGFPALDTSFEVSFNFIVSDAGVDVSFGFLGQDLSYFSPVSLNAANGLSLILFSDANSSLGEVYQINSLSFSNAQVSEPQGLSLIAFPVLGLVLLRWRRKKRPLRVQRPFLAC